jgi:hypothetical protein
MPSIMGHVLLFPIIIALTTSLMMISVPFVASNVLFFSKRTLVLMTTAKTVQIMCQPLIPASHVITYFISILVGFVSLSPKMIARNRSVSSTNAIYAILAISLMTLEIV